MVQAESHYGTITAQPSKSSKASDASGQFQMTFRGFGVLILAVSAVVCVATFSGQLGSGPVVLEQLTDLHQSTESEADVADAILDSTGHQGKMGSIPASIAALAAQAAHEKETGRLSTTVQLPQIPKSIAKMAAEAKHEILIERSIDAKRKAAAAKKALAKKASASAHSASASAPAKADAGHPAAAVHIAKAASKIATHKAAAHAKVVAKHAHHTAGKAANQKTH